MHRTLLTYLLGICLIFIFSNCDTTKKLAKTNPYQAKIIQGEKVFELDGPITVIPIKRKNFSIHFFTKSFQENETTFHATQIASFLEKDDLDLIFDNQELSQNPYLSPGTGLAAAPGKAYDSMYLTNSGHHYIYYDNKEDKRAQLVKTFSDGVMELKWEVNRFYSNDNFISFQDLSLESIYLVIFYDQNHNKIIEKEEYHRVELKFE